ncbi:uncharacterized protein N0V89_010532 [Didymosphaeria variabile]|uniref:Uncharacterized protein n=1 Tax=Didymosphaeria variabile TaxID=1932322 RepID=A0A9W8XBG3_9PLEO|nr:uncharacterized protein N0V89_010532 [Didymosphaeria variabile]KAJ4346601.1 hypothetical protein N0V89_010532 [Didymosphaeria variabile]
MSRTRPPQPEYVGFDNTPSIKDWNAYLGPDPYSIMVNGYGAMTNLPGDERFELVSSLFGPGNIACWICLIIQLDNQPVLRKKDTITNDFIAVLTFPIVAAGHFFHQIVQQTGKKHDGKTLRLPDLLMSLDRDDVQAVAAMEAPLTICEDFILWATLLYMLAARKGQLKRMSLVVATGSLCLATELLLLTNWVPFESSRLLRPFLFDIQPFIIAMSSWYLLMVVVYPLETLLGVLRALKTVNQADTEAGTTLTWRILRPGRLSSWMAGCSALVSNIGAIWIKYGSIYPYYPYSAYVTRFVPRSTAKPTDLDQVVAGLGGGVALLFSLLDALRERKKAKASAK